MNADFGIVADIIIHFITAVNNEGAAIASRMSLMNTPKSVSVKNLK